MTIAEGPEPTRTWHIKSPLPVQAGAIHGSRLVTLAAAPDSASVRITLHRHNEPLRSDIFRLSTNEAFDLLALRPHLIMATTSKGRVLRWHLPSLKPESAIRINGVPIAIHPDSGEVAFVPADDGGKRIRIGNIEARSERTVELTPGFPDANVLDGAFSQDGSHLATVLDDGSVRIWRLGDKATDGRRPVAQLSSPGDSYSRALFAAPQENRRPILALGRSGDIDLWEPFRDLGPLLDFARRELKRRGISSGEALIFFRDLIAQTPR